jgi:hypothetical protein
MVGTLEITNQLVHHQLILVSQIVQLEMLTHRQLIHRASQTPQLTILLTTANQHIQPSQLIILISTVNQVIRFQVTTVVLVFQALLIVQATDRKTPTTLTHLIPQVDTTVTTTTNLITVHHLEQPGLAVTHTSATIIMVVVVAMEDLAVGRHF